MEITVSGLYPLQQSLEIKSNVKILVLEVLSDRYRIRQEQFQCQGVEIEKMLRAYTLYQMSYGNDIYIYIYRL